MGLKRREDGEPYVVYDKISCGYGDNSPQYHILYDTKDGTGMLFRGRSDDHQSSQRMIFLNSLLCLKPDVVTVSRLSTVEAISDAITSHGLGPQDLTIPNLIESFLRKCRQAPGEYESEWTFDLRDCEKCKGSGNIPDNGWILYGKKPCPACLWMPAKSTDKWTCPPPGMDP